MCITSNTMSDTPTPSLWSTGIDAARVSEQPVEHVGRLAVPAITV